MAIVWLYTRIRENNLPSALFRRKRADPEAPEGVHITGSIASTVYLDYRDGTATKEYQPPRLVKAVYWLAFQAPFPYQHREDALKAAAAKRIIAGLLTKYRFGQDVVAQVREIRKTEGNYQFVTELIPGAAPRCNEEIAEELSSLSAYFGEVGLPRWQIAPSNPHACSNFIRTPQGELKLIDMESAMISLPSLNDLGSSMRDGHFPVFDDVDFVKLHGYVESQAAGLKRRLGAAAYGELTRAVEVAEAHSRTWKGSERRIWGRIAGSVYRHLDISRRLRGLRDRLDTTDATAKAFLDKAIERWERDGRIDARRAADLRAAMSRHEGGEVMKHMGAHLVLSVVIAVPIPGLRSLARGAWTGGFRVRAVYRRSRGWISAEEYRRQRAMHSLPVMLIALVPGFGSIAYIAGGPIVSSGLARVSIDQCLCKLPFGLYRRLNLDRLAAPRVPPLVTASLAVRPVATVASPSHRAVGQRSQVAWRRSAHAVPADMARLPHPMMAMESRCRSKGMRTWNSMKVCHGPPSSRSPGSWSAEDLTLSPASVSHQQMSLVPLSGGWGRIPAAIASKHCE
jgi:hypothetical protein